MLNLVKGGEWEKPLAAAMKARDPDPWLAFADWCAKNKPEMEAAARYVGQRCATTDDPPPAKKAGKPKGKR